MDFKFLLEHAEKELGVITGAPGAFVVAMILGWLVLGWLKRQQISNLQSEVSAFKAQAAFHKERADAAEAQVDRLNEQIAKPDTDVSPALQALADSGLAKEVIQQLVPERTVRFSGSPLSDPSTWNNAAQFSPNDIRTAALINQLWKRGGVVVNQLPSQQYTATGTASLSAVAVGGGGLQQAIDALREGIDRKGLSTNARTIPWEPKE